MKHLSITTLMGGIAALVVGALALPAATWAQASPDRPRAPWEMMHDWGWGSGWMWLMPLFMMAWFALMIAVIVLLTTIYVKTPLEFSMFPSLLLATTLGRLVLNVASTRLILTRAETDKLEAAGEVIRSFGEFVAGDKVVVGLIIFVIIIVIQFLVITKGATRISEVAATSS